MYKGACLATYARVRNERTSAGCRLLTGSMFMQFFEAVSAEAACSVRANKHSPCFARMAVVSGLQEGLGESRFLTVSASLSLLVPQTR
jgi:hypothetical protein